MRAMIYAAGGAGTNIIAAAQQQLNRRYGELDIDIAYIDTSRSNLSGKVSQDQIFIIEGGTDGSGKIRAENATHIHDSIPQILVDHQPGEYNIVVSSLGGGSGSVIAPELASELLQRGLNVVVLGVGSTSSVKEVENTLKTLQSYSNIAKNRNRPVAMGYYENVPGQYSPKQVDVELLADIEVLLMLFSVASISGSGLDTTDLRNWLDYTKASTYPARLMAFATINSKNPAVPEVFSHVVSVATLSDDIDTAFFGQTVDYHCTGIIKDDHTAGMLPVHYLIADGFFDTKAKDLNASLASLRQRASARRIAPSALDEATPSNGATGMVL